MLHQKRKTALVICVVTSLCFIWGCSSTPPSGSPQRPNIVYILADDLGYGDVSALNTDSRIQTPTIDRLISQGMVFTDAHSNSSVCTPTRYGILTGQYCWRSRMKKGVLLGYSPSLIEYPTPTTARYLKVNGYHTACIGKWHLGLDWKLKDGRYHRAVAGEDLSRELIQFKDHTQIDFSQPVQGGPRGAGFDYSFILPASLDFEPYCYLENNRTVEAPTAYTEGNCLDTGYTGAFWRPGQKAPSFKFEEVLPTFTDKAIEFIQAQKGKTKPFYLYLPLAAPHTPWVPTQRFAGSSPIDEYGDFVQMVDYEVGKVLKALRANGFGKNTLVVFTSDNGAYWKPDFIEKYRHRSNHKFRGMKSDAWEGGHRIPLVVKWPGKVKAGSTCNQTVCLTDFYDTLRSLMNDTDSQRPRDSYSLLPLLLRERETINRPPVIHHSGSGKFAIRSGDWKLIEGLGSGGFSKPKNPEPKPGEPTSQLYNLKEDPWETNNLYLKNPNKARELEQQLEEIRAN